MIPDLWPIDLWEQINAPLPEHVRAKVAILCSDETKCPLRCTLPIKSGAFVNGFDVFSLRLKSEGN